jgi:hypothetical protein
MIMVSMAVSREHLAHLQSDNKSRIRVSSAMSLVARCKRRGRLATLGRSIQQLIACRRDSHC